MKYYYNKTSLKTNERLDPRSFSTHLVTLSHLVDSLEHQFRGSSGNKKPLDIGGKYGFVYFKMSQVMVSSDALLHKLLWHSFVPNMLQTIILIWD